MSQQPKHSFPDLQKLHSQKETINIVYGTFEEITYYYAGAFFKPDTDAFTNVLRWYREDRYKDIVCFTHFKASLPNFSVDGNGLKESILSWRMYGKEAPKEKKEITSTDNAADFKLTWKETEEKTNVRKEGVPQKINNNSLRAHNIGWSNQIEEFFLCLEIELGLSWQGTTHSIISEDSVGPILVIACSEWLLPNPNLEDIIGSSGVQNYFQRRWDRIVERLQETESRVVIITPHLLYANILCEPRKKLRLETKDKYQYEDIMNLCTSQDEHLRKRKLDILHSYNWWVQFGNKSTPRFMLPYLNRKHPYGENYPTKDSEEIFSHHIAEIISTIKPKEAEDPMEQFKKYIGMEELKNSMDKLQQNVEKNLQKRHRHFLLEGNPGTGKTVVAKTIAYLLFKYGVVRENKFLSVTHKDLEGQYLGHSGSRTNTVIQKAYGGVLFIDEAHSLKGTNSFHKEVVSTMLPYMENEEHIGNIVFIFAGYPKCTDNPKDTNDVRELFLIDGGLESRINNIYTLPDYSPLEMVDIFYLTAKLRDIEVEDTPGFRKNLEEQIHVAKSKENARTFGNARKVRDYLLNLGEDISYRENRRNIILEDIVSYPFSQMFK